MSSKKNDWDVADRMIDDIFKESDRFEKKGGSVFGVVLKTLRFILWIYWKMFSLLIKGVKKMVFRKKKPKANDGIAFDMTGQQQPYPPQPPQQQYPQQFQQPQQPMPQQPYQQQPYPPQQQPLQPPEPPVQRVPNPFVKIQEAFKVLNEKIKELEADIDNIYDRLNTLQGVQPRPTKRIRFTKG